jgi:uroporphyrin-III C-methyltransferase
MRKPPETAPTALENLGALRGSYPRLEPGTVWIVGAGPGDPGLLTLDALAGLLQADAIVHDALIDKRTLAMASPGAQLLFVGKRGGTPSTSQTEITQLLINLARQDLRVLRLKGGDPFVFGRGGEEMLALAEAGIRFRVVPGITAGIGGLASALIPATVRDVNQAIILVTAHAPSDTGGVDWRALAKTGQPLVLYMAARNLQGISEALIQAGVAPSMPAAAVASATLEQQQVVESPLTSIAKCMEVLDPASPVLVVIGEIVRFRSKLLALLSASSA